MEIVRLGEGVDRTGRLSPAALERTFAACDAYAEVIRATGAERVRFVATSASRDVENRDDFVAGVRDRLGVDPEVVTGDEEARLSFAGATRELLGRRRRDALPGRRHRRRLDRAGARRHATSTAARSVDVGCVRMTERHLHDDPPTAEQVAAARADVEAAVRHAARTVPLAEARTLVGLAGSVTTVAAMALGLPAYDPDRIHHSRISAADVHDVARDAARDDPDRAGGAAVHAPGPGRRHRRRRPGARRRPRERAGRRGRWSPSTTSSTASPGAWRRTVDGAHSHWPLLDLQITTGDLELRPLVEADLAEVVRVMPADLELNPHATRFDVPEDVHRAVVVHMEYWRSYGTWSTDAWRFHLAVRRDGELLGLQELEGNDFPTLRTVDTSSWLVPEVRGTGLGKAMRRAVLCARVRPSRCPGRDHLGVARQPRVARRLAVARLPAERRVLAGARRDGVDTLVHLRMTATTGPPAAGRRHHGRGCRGLRPWFGI